jgi:starch synthase
MMNEKKRVLHVSAECYPAAKVGGLADVVGALPKYQQRLGWNASVVMPWYDMPWFKNSTYEVVYRGTASTLSHRPEFELRRIQSFSSFPLFTIYFTNTALPSQVYNMEGTSRDEFEWFLQFQVAVLEWVRSRNNKPYIIHCHDHHTGLIPFFMTQSFRYLSLRTIPTLFTVHNGRYHGQVPLQRSRELPGFELEKLGLLEWDGKLDPLGTALKTAWQVTTVSEGYLEELMEEGSLSKLYQMEREKCIGVLNGIDTETWNPETDPFIEKHYTPKTLINGKRANKNALSEHYGIKPDRPLITFIGRLVHEKGADLLPELIEKLAVNMEIPEHQFFILGSGDKELEKRIEKMCKQYDEHCKCHIGYNESLAHQLYAGSDFLFMPSRVEPCGLNQMYAMHYGTIPIVRAVGGLKDTVKPIRAGKNSSGDGFVFKEFDLSPSIGAIDDALLFYEQKEAFRLLQKQLMGKDFSWEQSAHQYLNLYKQLNQDISV